MQGHRNVIGMRTLNTAPRGFEPYEHTDTFNRRGARPHIMRNIIEKSLQWTIVYITEKISTTA